VFLLTETFRRGKGQEEDNIYYVAVTRAMKELYFVGGKQTSPAVEPSRLAASAPVPAAVPLPATAGVSLSNYNLPAGLIYHRPGNVIKIDGAEWVCIAVNDCTAKFTRCSKVKREIVNRFDESKNRTVEFTSNERLNICSTCEPGFIARVMAKNELKVFLDRAAGKSENETNTGKQIEENSMSKKTKAKSVKADKPEGKMDLCRRLLKDGMDREEILKEFLKKFPGTKEKTAHNSINWVATKMGHANPKSKKPAKASKAPAKLKAASKVPARKLPQAPKLPVPPNPASLTPPPRPVEESAE
jgi:ATP-dependent exoDNAse (exonuclease V) beta subunit